MYADLANAIQYLESHSCTCVLCKGEHLYVSTDRGIRPLLDWQDHAADLKGFSAADKVVGKAAAFLYILLGVKSVYAPVMSSDAVRLLEQSGVSAQCEKSVPRIINRAGTGLCPMEEAVAAACSPQEALSAIRKKLKMLEK